MLAACLLRGTPCDSLSLHFLVCQTDAISGPLDRWLTDGVDPPQPVNMFQLEAKV